MFLNDYIKKWSQWWYKRLKLNTEPVIKVYHGFGSRVFVRVFGHAFRMSPYKQEKFTKSFWRNGISILRLFMVKPYTGVTLEMNWQGINYTTRTQDDGFYAFEWAPEQPLTEGWHNVYISMTDAGGRKITGQGRFFIPGDAPIALVSDIDDTFLISYSANLRKRLYVLLTKNARSRRTFEGVAHHYRTLVTGGKDKLLRPFFYVSSSEWNLYDYIREFSRNYRIPDGIYLLNQVKQLHEFLKSGQTSHNGKYLRIARLLISYPEKRFVLFGDDTQQDPHIYYKLSKDFPGRIVCIYLRHVRRSRLPVIKKLEAQIRSEGGEVCYFKHSHEAIEHSKKIGLI